MNASEQMGTDEEPAGGLERITPLAVACSGDYERGAARKQGGNCSFSTPFESRANSPSIAANAVRKLAALAARRKFSRFPEEIG
jgi:hypothetical protein